jgi:hypothetical protein
VRVCVRTQDEEDVAPTYGPPLTHGSSWDMHLSGFRSAGGGRSGGGGGSLFQPHQQQQQYQQQYQQQQQHSRRGPGSRSGSQRSDDGSVDERSRSRTVSGEGGNNWFLGALE